MARRGNDRRPRSQPSCLFVAHVNEFQEGDGVCVPSYPPPVTLLILDSTPRPLPRPLYPCTFTLCCDNQVCPPLPDPYRCPVIVPRHFSPVLVFILLILAGAYTLDMNTTPSPRYIFPRSPLRLCCSIVSPSSRRGSRIPLDFAPAWFSGSST
jgi:hypothetical protein